MVRRVIFDISRAAARPKPTCTKSFWCRSRPGVRFSSVERTLPMPDQEISVLMAGYFSRKAAEGRFDGHSFKALPGRGDRAL